MLRVKLLSSIAAITAVATLSANAQELQLQGLQRNVDIFSGVLEEALDFNQAKGLFGVSLGGIDSTYLYGQGVVMEVRTPLASGRNRMGLASLSSAIQSLQSRAEMSDLVSAPQIPNRNAQAPRLSLSTSAEEISDFYAEVADRIANIDYSLIVNDAIRQASDSARALRSMGNVDDSVYEELRVDIDALRENMQINTQELREIVEEARRARTQAAATADADIESELRNKLDALMTKIEPLREQAIAKAAELKQRREEAEQAYATQWQEDVLELETKLYAAMCDYGSTLRELPDGESVSIILTGLGEAAEDHRRKDKLHVFNKSDLLQCQSGDIDQAMLQQRSIQYSY